MKELSAQPQQSLGEFLRTIRERLTPEQVGLSSSRRRRAPGLRREEVAYLANVGISWYTAIEQGQNVHPSFQVLESLAGALKLSADERRYLFLLAKRLDKVVEKSESFDEVGKGLERTILALEPHPAYILGKYWEVLMWNRAAEYVFQFSRYRAKLRQQPKLNLLNYVIDNPFGEELEPKREERAKIMVARFRADSARYPHDARMNGMIERFRQESELFRKWWSYYEVDIVSECHKIHQDPQIGALEFEQVALQLPDNPDLKLMIFTASPSTAQRLEQEIYAC